MRGNADDRPDCGICGAPLPSRYERESARGRPRRWCGNRCKERARRAAELDRRAQAMEEVGRANVAARIRERIEVETRLWRVS